VLESIRITSLLLLGCVLLSACRRETLVQSANRDGVLLVGNSAEPRALDPHRVTGVPESKILSSLFEGLVADHPSDDDAMAPGVAIRWEHDAEMKQWVFHLRPEARWSDGKPLTAADFVFSYHRMLHPSLAAAYAPMLYPICHAEAYNRDERGHILCGMDSGFPLEWEVLGQANFRGIEGGQDPAGAKDAREARRLVFASKGLDRLNAAELRAILDEPGLFDWPDEISAAVRAEVVSRLLVHAEAGAPDLFHRASVGVRARDPHTLEIQLREPMPYLPSVVRHFTWYPVPRHVVLRHGGMADRQTAWSEAGNLVGNGPFVLSRWRFNHFIEVVRNPRYWDAPSVGLNAIRFYPIENPYTEARSFLAGQLHTTYTMPPEMLGRMSAKHPEFLRVEPYVGTAFVRLNVNRRGLDDPRVRRAISLAIHREDYCRHIYEGYLPAQCMTPDLAAYQGPRVLRHDLAEARALLAEAGYPGGAGLPPYAILTSRPHPVSDALQQTLRLLGLRVTVERKDWGSYIAAQQELRFDMAIGSWIGDYLDPTTFLEMWTRGNGNNNTGWHSPAYEALLREAALQSDAAARQAALFRAEEILMDAMPVVPIAWNSRIYLHRPEVRGWHPLMLDNHPWKTIRLTP
jgi:oligopeptide transport system substrate-binding protein